MEQPFLELDNGQIDLRLASDGSRLEITPASGLRREWDVRYPMDEIEYQ